jgi:hypothetical protein
LADYEQVAGNVQQRAIHLAFVVREDAQPDNLVRHPFELSDAISGSKSHQQEVSPANLPDRPTADSNLRVSNSLEEYPHSTVTDLARFLG